MYYFLYFPSKTLMKFLINLKGMRRNEIIYFEKFSLPLEFRKAKRNRIKIVSLFRLRSFVSNKVRFYYLILIILRLA